MNKEIISDKQKIFVITFYLIGETSTYILGFEARQDFWLAIIFSILFALIMVFIYARLYYLFPEKDLFDITTTVFGRIIGKAIILLFVWYTFEYVSQILTYLSGYINIVTFPDLPKLAPATCGIILCIWIAKAGIQVIGRYTELFLPFIIVLIFTTAILLIPQMNMDNLYPILYNNMKPVLQGSFIAFVYPFGEIVIFAMLFSTFETKKSPYKIFALALFISGIMMIITSLTNVLVLGVNASTGIYFPSYSSVARMDVGDFLQRMEVISSTVFILGATIKAGILLLVTSKGISKIFECEDYRFVVSSIALLAINLFYLAFDSNIDAYEFYFEIYSYFITLFQVILPLIIWIAAEIENKLGKIQLR